MLGLSYHPGCVSLQTRPGSFFPQSRCGLIDIDYKSIVFARSRLFNFVERAYVKCHHTSVDFGDGDGDFGPHTDPGWRHMIKFDPGAYRILAWVEVLQQQLPDGALERINLYFPDPWPKKRHHKRRLVQAAFLRLAASKLAACGTLQIATDWENYAEHIDELIAGSPEFTLAERHVHDDESAAPDRQTTKFERRGLRQGHNIWYWRLSKQ